MPGLPPCEFCRGSHCTSHLLPEVHGCRDAVRNAGRMDASRDATATLKAKKLNDNKDLRAKLAQKREELAQQRSKQPKK